MIEMPVRRGEAYSLVWVVAMRMVRMVAVNHGAPVEADQRIVIVCRTIAVVDVYACRRTVFSGCETDCCSWIHSFVYGKLNAGKCRLRCQSVVGVASRR